MLALFLLLQVQQPDSTYSSPGLRHFIAEAAQSNRELPRDLHGYRAALESDLALVVGDPRGQEHAGQIEQVASALTWQRSGELEQRVVGYRARGSLALSTLSLLPQPWIIPSLYGDRLRLVLLRPRDPDKPPPRQPLTAVHPLASDRDSVYRFTGGDTVVQLQMNGRTLHLVHVKVTPRARPNTRLLVFRGDLYLDAERKQLVRMRGELAVLVHKPSAFMRLLNVTMRGFVFIDIVEGEFQERYWLPTYQRIDMQVRSSLAADFQPVFRVVTRFHNHVLDTLGSATATSATESARTVGTLSYAPADSMNRYTHWLSEIGVESAASNARDFEDLAGEPWHRSGLLRYRWTPERFSDVFRFNRVEGLFTGFALSLRLSDSLPDIGSRIEDRGSGLNPPIHSSFDPRSTIHDPRSTIQLGAHGGFAWAEQTARGALTLRYPRERWSLSLTAERALVNTNDFVPPLETVATLGALFASVDDFDYLDRQALTFGVTRALNSQASHFLRLEAGAARDASVLAHRRRGLFVFDSLFRANRPVTEGSYFREFVALEINPGVSGEYLEPGVGVTLSYEAGHGQPGWQRIDGLLTARRAVGGFTYAGRLDVVALFGGIPLQRLPEFGANEGLPGYGYKQFGGDRAALLRLGLGYTLPVARSVLRPRRWLILPAPAPTISAGLQSGWAAVREPGTMVALTSLGTRPDPDRPGSMLPLTQPTDGIRSTVAISLDFFGGAIGVGLARPIDRRAPWKLVLGSAQLW